MCVFSHPDSCLNGLVQAGTCLIWKGLCVAVLKISFSPSAFNLIWIQLEEKHRHVLCKTCRFSSNRINPLLSRQTFLQALSSLRWILTNSSLVVFCIIFNMKAVPLNISHKSEKMPLFMVPQWASKKIQSLFPQALISHNGLLSHEQILDVLWHLLTECSLLLVPTVLLCVLPSPVKVCQN